MSRDTSTQRGRARPRARGSDSDRTWTARRGPSLGNAAADVIIGRGPEPATCTPVSLNLLTKSDHAPDAKDMSSSPTPSPNGKPESKGDGGKGDGGKGKASQE